jgi:hypothetical protein
MPEQKSTVPSGSRTPFAFVRGKLMSAMRRHVGAASAMSMISALRWLAFASVLPPPTTSTRERVGAGG